MVQTLEDGSTQAYLIDYGFASKLYGANNSHIAEEETVDAFQGNLYFSSLR